MFLGKILVEAQRAGSADWLTRNEFTAEEIRGQSETREQVMARAEKMRQKWAIAEPATRFRVVEDGKQPKTETSSVPDEPALADNYPVYAGFWYVMDDCPRRSNIQGNVSQMKRAMDVRSVRRCNAVWRGLPL